MAIACSGLRAPRASVPDGFTTLTLDVTQDASVAACVAEVIKTAGRPDGREETPQGFAHRLTRNNCRPGDR
jgi:hypothetical protein